MTAGRRPYPYESTRHSGSAVLRIRIACRAAACVASALLLVPVPASADWLLAFYAGAATTASNTLAVTPDAGAAVSIGSVEYEGRSFESPLYYGYRIGWTPRGRAVGIEAEFTHAKAIAVQLPSIDLTAFQLSHGLNFLLGNVTYRTGPRCGGRCTLVARGGAGITVPHVEATFRGVTTSAYQYAGFGAQGGVGVELPVWKPFSVVADARITHARVRTDLAAGRLAGPFTSAHADVGIAWRSRR
jgi:hypothetical protein